MEAEGCVRIAGNIGACAAVGVCLNASPPFRFETLDVMTFNDAGKIISMQAYWGEANYHPIHESGSEHEEDGGLGMNRVR